MFSEQQRFNVTYSLSVVLDWLRERGLHEGSWALRSAPMAGAGWQENGVVVRIPGTQLEVSVQTHPSVAAWAFAETAVLDQAKKRIRGDTSRWPAPPQLFAYLEGMLAGSGSEPDAADGADAADSNPIAAAAAAAAHADADADATCANAVEVEI